MVSLPAHLVATPVLERLAVGPRGARSGGRGSELEGPLHGGELEGVVLGVGATAAWVDLDGFVIAITTREVPLLPNAIALAAGSGALAGAGAGSGGTARLGQGRLTLGSLQVTWNPAAPPSWDPTVPVPEGVTLLAVGARGAALLRALGAEGAVDNHENQLPRSATLPHRGPEQPAGAKARAPVRELGRDPAGGPARELGRGPALGPARVPAGGLARNAARDPAGDPAEDPTQHPAQDPIGNLVRELAQVGLATAADPEGAAGLDLLFQAVRERDPEPAAVAVRALLGRGPGLTPEGDDLLAAVAGTLAVLGPAISGPAVSPHELDRDAGRPDPSGVRRVPDLPLDPVLAALAPRPGRTTALSATLLALAATRRLPEPAGRLLDLSPAGEKAWPAALARLERLGHGSGRAYAAGIAATASLLGAAAAHQ